MYAIVKTSGRQYRVSKGAVIEVARLAAEPGSEVALTEVLLVGAGDKAATHIGKPIVAGASVTAKVLEHAHAPKVRVVKFRRRKNYRRQLGHRQALTRLEITDINAKAATPAAVATPAAQDKTEPATDGA